MSVDYGYETDYGFLWGPMEVTRLSSIEGRGQVLGIKVGGHSLQLYASPKGRSVRLFDGSQEIPLRP